jgi:uncharacterized radical SAM superfamily protein
MTAGDNGIEFVYPTRTAEVSITGKACALRCAHCNALLLRDIGRTDPKSYLVSGGCNREGEVPLAENIETLRRLARGHRLIVHTGLIREENVKKIAPFVHAASFNFMCDDETIREVYGLNKSGDDYVEAYCALRRHVKAVPHITIGLNRGRIVSERKAFEILGSLGAEAVVLNILIPTPGTRYAALQPPPVESVVDVIGEARRSLRDTPLFLGCMRPGGRYRDTIDREAVKLGMDRIVMPSHRAVQLAERTGLTIGRRDECCIL